jgi:enamine deaminase RidA (YjgF/YER057c/UK114 family)
MPQHRAVSDRMLSSHVLSSHAPASAYLEASELARPEFLFEVEGEAVRES